MNEREIQGQIERVRAYQRDPLLWVEDIFGENIRRESGIQHTRTGLTTQQEEFFTEFGKLIGAKLDAHAGRELTDEQKVYAAKIGISIMSGQGTGKDFTGAMAMWFFLFCFSHAKCLATANTAKQLRNVYWAELSKVARMAKKLNPDDPKSPTVIEHLFEWQSERVFYRPLRGKEWFCEAVTINAKGSAEEQATALAGRHEKHMLFLVDEASGVPDPVFKPLEGTLTGKLNLVLLIFNPTRRTGFAVESQKDPRFIPLRWSSEDSEMVSKQHIENMERRYGRNSPPFRIRVLGLPPTVDTDALIPSEWVQDAVVNEIEPAADDPVIFGVDVGAGGDKSVILVRHGMKVLDIKRFSTHDTMEFVGRVVNAMDEYGPRAVFIDPIGVGHGVYCRLKELGFRNVYAADVRKKSESEKFKYKRDELWWRVRSFFEEGIIQIPDHRDLVDQLEVLKMEPPDSTGRQCVQSKQVMRRQGLESPDEADALMLSFWKKDSAFRNRAQSKKVSLQGVYLR